MFTYEPIIGQKILAIEHVILKTTIKSKQHNRLLCCVNNPNYMTKPTWRYSSNIKSIKKTKDGHQIITDSERIYILLKKNNDLVFKKYFKKIVKEWTIKCGGVKELNYKFISTQDFYQSLK